ncbi:DUF819 family protein [Xenorhabdus hominickii]|nr:DUF819 family protein [Xenorhabdus hominickii]
MLGTIIAFLLFRKYIPELDKISGMISASYTGGGVNFAAMTVKLEPSQSMVASTIVADNTMMVGYFILWWRGYRCPLRISICSVVVRERIPSSIVNYVTGVSERR